MKRKGRTRLPKVGTPAERQYALHHEQEAVAANFGLSGRGWLFWTAIVMIIVLVVVGLLTWVLL
jgi:cytochrome b subunit of formate dehydrogenase